MRMWVRKEVISDDVGMDVIEKQGRDVSEVESEHVSEIANEDESADVIGELDGNASGGVCWDVSEDARDNVCGV